MEEAKKQPIPSLQETEYANYYKHIRSRISLHWFLGYGTRADLKLETKDKKPIIIEFKVYPNGAIDDIKIAYAAGNVDLASRLVATIEKASPINPFPPNIKEPSIDVRFNFYFSDEVLDGNVVGNINARQTTALSPQSLSIPSVWNKNLQKSFLEPMKRTHVNKKVETFQESVKKRLEQGK